LKTIAQLSGKFPSDKVSYENYQNHPVVSFLIQKTQELKKLLGQKEKN